MLDVRELSVYYGDAQALDQVSMSVGAGEIVALVGANGAGKTSLIRSVAGILKPRSGSIRFEDQEIAGLDSHRVCNRGIGQVAEGRQVFPSLTVLENLQVGAMLPRARAGAERALEHVFALFPRLKERAGQDAGTLSGGEQQMLATGRALVGNPRLLLLDEPTEGLSPLIVRELAALFGRLRSEGTTILLIEQRLKFALSLADRVYVMSKGQMVAERTPDALLADDDLRHRYLGV